MNALLDIDELPHTPPTPLPDRWQENFFIVLSDRGKRAGFLIHCKRWPASGGLVARIAAFYGDVIVSRKVAEPIPNGVFAVGGLTLHPETPYRQLRLTGSFEGMRGYGPLGFIAWEDGGDVPVEIDFTLTSTLPPADFGDAFRLLDESTAGENHEGRPVYENSQVHYEQGGRCTGTMTIDGALIEVDGLFVRDHTWGTRDESSMSATGHGFWTASISEDGNVFFNATGMVINGKTRGVGVVVDKDGVHSTTDVDVTFLPADGLGKFHRTAIRIGGEVPIEVEGTSLIHLVKYLPGSGAGRYDDNALSDWQGSGLSGFGVHEFAGTLPQEQRRVLDGF
ncbi:hypothetical protein F1C10_11480 [Sphingomonas sp. NBWT7]|uniref:DUF7065 domain-containing protein n=1 Tax=Sphingomonas sp. NBWT7 TaxID=2596913 RepID=UPI001625CB1E|nr:hypothetical protein [Sphingomonas sp. NBWT7]QNE32505.1 hypothetical protein F1C10_11480 [Sphingomonas sp. NBWT7]